jgi:hypothetical protein
MSNGTSQGALNREIAATIGASDLPADLTNWLAHLSLLIGVPFQNLVSSELLLEPESIKFFRLDPAWMGALIDGALSIGRHYSAADATSPMLVAEQIHGPRLQARARASMADFRKRQLKKTTDGGLREITEIISGFLLRSKVVAGWKSMDVMGYALGASPYDLERNKIPAEQVRPLEILRLELLSPTVLLGLFQGQLYQLVLHQPPEAIHFGFQTVKSTNNQVTKNLRTPTTNWDDPLTYYDTQGHRGRTLDGIFTDRSRRVVDLVKLSQALAHELDSVGRAPGYYQPAPDMNHQNHLLSSDFALEMVQGVGLVSFINDVLPKQDRP